LPGALGDLAIVDANQAATVDRVYAAGNCAEPRALVPAAAGNATAAVTVIARLCSENADRAVARIPSADRRSLSYTRPAAPVASVRRPIAGAWHRGEYLPSDK
jgi:pyruvate/2-oxoglutarate dehydrogenase complex dihydrolipoamide dehydrogenase (E3) component